jgi:hypothetical protein
MSDFIEVLIAGGALILGAVFLKLIGEAIDLPNDQLVNQWAGIFVVGGIILVIVMVIAALIGTRR